MYVAMARLVAAQASRTLRVGRAVSAERGGRDADAASVGAGAGQRLTLRGVQAGLTHRAFSRRDTRGALSCAQLFAGKRRVFFGTGPQGRGGPCRTWRADDIRTRERRLKTSVRAARPQTLGLPLARRERVADAIVGQAVAQSESIAAPRSAAATTARRRASTSPWARARARSTRGAGFTPRGFAPRSCIRVRLRSAARERKPRNHRCPT